MIKKEHDKEIFEIEGFHNTEIKNIDDIIKNEFIPVYRKTHWLGQGIYFFDNLDIANDNKNMLEEFDEMVTIGVKIKVPMKHYLDLDNKDNQTIFREYCNEVIDTLGEAGLEILYKEAEQEKKNIKKLVVFRCFCLDLYKTEKKFFVITKTFPKDNPCYGIKIKNFDFLGFPYLERYICVSDNLYIENKRIIEQEWIV